MGNAPSTIKGDEKHATVDQPLEANAGSWRATAQQIHPGRRSCKRATDRSRARSDRYPEGTTFIASDQEGFSSILAEAVAEHRPVAFFFPDGHEIVTA